MTIVATTFEKRLVVGGIVIGRIQLARLAFASHAVALDLTKVRRGRAQPLACELDQLGLHYHPARPIGGMAVTCPQHPRKAHAAADLATVHTAIADTATHPRPLRVRAAPTPHFLRPFSPAVHPTPALRVV